MLFVAACVHALHLYGLGCKLQLAIDSNGQWPFKEYVVGLVLTYWCNIGELTVLFITKSLFINDFFIC